MLAKPLTFLLVFLLTIANFIVLLIPVSLLVFPLFMFFQSLFLQVGPDLLFFLISRISAAIILYVLLDTFFGFTMRRMRKGCVPFKKASAVYGHKDIMESFDWLKKKFKISNVKLYLDPNFNVVNAYAIGSFSGSTVTITMGLINKLQQGSSSYEEFIDVVRGILGHEMSHLTNKDFLPGLLTSASESASRKISMVIRWFFIIFAYIFRIFPWIGWPISKLIIAAYNIVNYIIMAFFNLIFMPIYNFLLKFFGRAIEYRCDRESAYAYGGDKMAKALIMLGAKGYFSLFSTHPTTNSRVKKVQNILPKDGTIRPGIINMFSNFVSLVFIVFICTYSTSLVNIPNMYESYINEVYNPINQKLDGYQRSVMQVYYKYKPMLGR